MVGTSTATNSNSRRHGLSTRNCECKWGPLLLAVACLYSITFSSSVSKYSIPVDYSEPIVYGQDNNLSRSMASYNLSSDVHLAVNLSSSGRPLLKYSNRMDNDTINNNVIATVHDHRWNQPSSKDDIEVIHASTTVPPTLQQNDTTFPGRTGNYNATKNAHSSRNQSTSLAAPEKTPAYTEAVLVDNHISGIPPSPLPLGYDNTMLQNPNSPHANASSSAYFDHYSTDIDLVSLTVRHDFFVLFNNSAITSWLSHIQNVRSVTFIGPSKDYGLFLRNMQLHYPQLRVSDIHENGNIDNIDNGAAPPPPIRWINETHWKTAYKNKYRCPYPTVCQQLIKLHVFDLRTRLGLEYVGDNVLVVDSDTVWSRDATFVHPDGRAHYFDVRGTHRAKGGADATDECTGMDPIKFTEAITMGSSLLGPRKPTLTPYRSCARPEHPDATGGRHIVHHMLFQRDVMAHLHAVIENGWGVGTLWEAFVKCNKHRFCKSRIAEYELYFAFVSNQYPERVRVESLVNGENYMGSSAICGEAEMECCRDRGVLLKGCHDHRVRKWEKNKAAVGDMCCT